MASQIIMPEMGEGVIEGTVVSWLKQTGDHINSDEPLLEVETDKVTVEINAEEGGVVLEILVEEGATVPAGTVLAVIGQPGEKISANKPNNGHATDEPSPQYQPTRTAPPSTITDEQQIATVNPSRDDNGQRISPVVARMAEEHNLDLSLIEGTGLNGRITKKDVQSFLLAQDVTSTVSMDAVPQTTFPEPSTAPTKAATVPMLKADVTAQSAAQSAAQTGDELVKLSGMRRGIAEHMVMSKHTSPHVTTVFEFDYSAVAKHRAEHKSEFALQGIKLTYMPYLVQAVAEALKKHPMANAQWTDDGILLKKQINIGLAVAIDKGLLVPVIKGADELNLRGLAKAINDLADRARTNKLMPTEIQGGTFSITNHGASGSLIGTPIINQPQAGILGIGVIEKRVKVINDAIAIRPCAYVSFSFDHRILDGATADAFVMDIKQFIENYH